VILVCPSVALPGIAVAQNATALNFGPPSHGGPGGPTSIDPGVRGGTAGAGGPLAGLNDQEQAYFTAAKNVFMEVDSVAKGLGPRFNLDSCAGCHAAPAVGGSSPAANPQVAVATLNGAKNDVPRFITSDGPVREARFVKNPDGTLDGGVHDLFVISGRSDAVGCNITQPNFSAALAQNNVIFRIPTPTFGLGLVENVSDDDLQAALADKSAVRAFSGISGEFNRSGNDGTITRFGWKAQNKSLLIFAGEAYNVEQGVTNELFPNERETDPSCQYNATPEDRTPIVSVVDPTGKPLDYSSDVVSFAMFMRLSAPPAPVVILQPN
jgi:Di-haem oxidoreductase, putative peroxidase